MSQPNEQYAYFAVFGSFDPEEITRRIGVGPSDSWREGEVHTQTKRERRFSRWALHSRLPRTAPLEAHVRDVLTQLDQGAGRFVSLSQDYGGCMQLVGYFHEGYPGLQFDADIVAGLARYALSVDFDFYHLLPDERDEA